MRKLLLLALLLLLSNFGQAQTTGPGFVIYVGSAPSGTCSAGAYQEDVIGLGTVYTCQSGTWTQISGGGGGSGTVTSIATTSPITGGTITATGTIACATCVKATSPGAGIAHFAGSTQEVTSSLIVNADITASTIDLTTKVTGALSVANGGTGAATLAAHGVVVGNTTSAVSVTGAGTSGQVLTSNGASADPTFQAASGAGTTKICDSTGLTDTLVTTGSFATTCVVTANTLVAGALVHIQAGGVESAPGGCTAPDNQYAIKEGSTTVLAAIGHTSSNGNNFGWALNATFLVSKAGASGKISGIGGINAGASFLYQENNTSTGPLLTYATLTSTQDSTASQTFSIPWTGFGGSGCTTTLNNFLLTVTQP